MDPIDLGCHPGEVGTVRVSAMDSRIAPAGIIGPVHILLLYRQAYTRDTSTFCGYVPRSWTFESPANTGRRSPLGRDAPPDAKT